MITSVQFNDRLTELNVEFRKVIGAGMTAEAFSWLVNAAAFLEVMVAEAHTLGDITETERSELDIDGGLIRNVQQCMNNCLIERNEKEETT